MYYISFKRNIYLVSVAFLKLVLMINEIPLYFWKPESKKYLFMNIMVFLQQKISFGYGRFEFLANLNRSLRNHTNRANVYLRPHICFCNLVLRTTFNFVVF